MAQACPINFTSVDNTISRIVSFLTSFIVILFLIFDEKTLLVLLGADLVVRLYGDKRYSPLYQFARFAKQTLKMPSVKVDGAAKRVAGHFGLSFVLLLLVCAFAGLHVPAYIIAVVYIACLAMDVAFNFCLGCKVYHLYRLLK